MQLEHLGNDVGLLNLSSLLSRLESRSERQCMVWLAGAPHEGETDRMDWWKQSSMQELVSENRLSITVTKHSKVFPHFFLNFEVLVISHEFSF